MAPMAYIDSLLSTTLRSTTRLTVMRRRAFQLARYLSTFAMSGAKPDSGSLMLERGRPRYVWRNFHSL